MGQRRPDWRGLMYGLEGVKVTVHGGRIRGG